ncbi:tyrosine-protein phosphatase non-receptor type 1 isoform X3 [Diachasma alloeum]|uniref:tyrosine-protein phosphatase non-receptor type 1 isoform X3 n=1 Tax=Diachasma alloeum TaxID=454923 RepID=UPI0007382338|nr:tyrosine-protein phosphatase non-receptor type 1 isoform X3 [Diachasma alloeum]
MTNEIKQPVSNLETEYLEINSKNAWPIFYQQIRDECFKFNYTCNESRKPRNKNLNRYRDVAPYDHTRIILQRGSCDYINASFIMVDRAHRHYILTQGPLQSTSGHFWLMVWEQNSKAIIMLNKVIEKGQAKCDQYWPLETSEDPSMTFFNVNLKVEFVSRTQAHDYTTRVLRLTDLDSQESREILHFHYTTWPDFGVPQSPTAFLQFLNDVRRSGALDWGVGSPIVHCSAGIGRSGTFCLVDTCLMLIEKNGLNSVNVRDVLVEMRRSRVGLIQTPDQLRFSYAAIIEGSRGLPSNNVNGATIENHYDIVNNIHNLVNQNNVEVEEEEEEEDDDEPPPLPPPRGESLTRSVMSDQLSNESTPENEIEPRPPNKPLPMEPTPKISNSHNNEDHTPNSSHPNNELRHRNQEKRERLATQVRDMKRRQKETEDWQNFKRSLFNPVTIGIDQKMKQRKRALILFTRRQNLRYENRRIYLGYSKHKTAAYKTYK